MSKQYDSLVLGSGVAGLTSALKLARLGSVAVITKKSRAESSTNYAQGGIACVTSAEDSFELHVQDTLTAGAGLCKEEVVRSYVAEAPARIRELIEIGVRFSGSQHRADGATTVSGLDLGREGGHSKRRILHAKDMTGREVERALLATVERHPNITIFENATAIDLITATKIGAGGTDRCLGAYVLDNATNSVVTFTAKVTVLATGGCGKCYLYTTNPDIATGDGVALAFRAGVGVANMEFIQFHPTCLYHPLTKSFLISEALRGEGAVLVNGNGAEFASKYDPRASLAPRDIVARAIDAEMKRTGAACVFLDITRKREDFLRERFPNIFAHCESLGINIARQPIPVVPAAHYQCGGVLVNPDGATALAGLYAVGEVACTGLHGANRLASNSLLEALVLAQRSAARIERALAVTPADVAVPEWEEGSASDPDELVIVTHNWREIRQIMWDYVGIVRTDKRLARAARRLEILLKEIHEYYWNFKVTGDLLELRNLALTSWLIVQSAMQRKESRGLHYTLNYPAPLPVARDTVIDRRDG
ncbi:MAG: L-aspartate oxidase [Verrucomicrobiales bacterium]|jgi:L-aspartate oxidase|nr:L-aspartate oxidase [Verrucomicrobiales bacterium]